VPRARRTLLIAAFLALASGAPAAAAAEPYALPPARTGLYGGGAVRDYLHFVSLRVRPDGGLTAQATLVTRCAPRFGDHLTEDVSVRGVTLDGDGRYTRATSFTDRVDPGVPLTGGLYARGMISVAARVGANGLARGTVRVRTIYSRRADGPAVSRCDTGSILWTARRPAADAGTGRVRLQPGVHRGTTAQDEPFLMRVTGGGGLVRRAGLAVLVGCRSAVGLPFDVVARNMRVRHGAFGAAGHFARPFTDPHGRRVIERYGWVLRGRFGSRGARGTFELDGVVRRRGDGKRLGSCGTGEIAWRASR
jgi:hypothetical protein